MRVGTRGSILALEQTKQVLKLLNCKAEIITIKTTGDKITNIPLYRIGGKGLFIKEIEQALLDKKIDIAVHSLKDVPTYMDQRFIIGAYIKRQNPFDTFISKKNINDQGIKIGTCSPRRIAQIKYINPTAEIFPLRGNINSRLDKYLRGELDAIVLAECGLNRIGKFGIGNIMENMVPAACQGVIAVQVLKENAEYIKIISEINDPETDIISTAERIFLEEVDGSCYTPVGVFCERIAEGFKCDFMLADDDFSNVRFHKEIIPEYDLLSKVPQIGKMMKIKKNL